jgi:hypothetical protein
VAAGCVENTGEPRNGYGYNATRVETGVYVVALTGYDFPVDFDPDQLVVILTAEYAIQQRVTTYYDSSIGFAFMVEFADIAFNPTNSDFCFYVLDVSTDPYAE